MSPRSDGNRFDATILARIKVISGKRIEEHRRRMNISQEKLATRAGIGVRWLREIEAGSPKPRIDDHLRCTQVLGLSSGHIVIPLLFMEHQITMPRHFHAWDMTDLVRNCIEFIADHHAALVERELAPLRRPRLSDGDN